MIYSDLGSTILYCILLYVQFGLVLSWSRFGRHIVNLVTIDLMHY